MLNRKSTESLLPVLYLADGLLSLSMLSPLNLNTNDSYTKHLTGINQDSRSPKNMSSQSSFTNHAQHTPDNLYDSFLPSQIDSQLIWRSYLRVRLKGNYQNDSSSIQGRCGLPKLISTNSTLSSGSSSNQSSSNQVSASFTLAKQGFDQIGLADEPKIVTDRFHSWLSYCISNQSNMGEVLSILHSGQMNGTWVDYLGQPLLAWPLACGHGSVAMALCQRGANVNCGLVGSALHYAINYGQLPFVKYLLGSNEFSKKHYTETNIANPRLRDLRGRTPAQMALIVLEAANQRGENLQTYQKLARIVQQSEEQFKSELNFQNVNPFTVVFRLALPVLVEAYMTTTKPEIRMRALQILCYTIRSRTGFITLYQMQKSTHKQTNELGKEKTNRKQINFGAKLVHMLASVINQGSTEELFLALSLIPALIDQPYFLNWMHRYGISQLLEWRSKSYMLKRISSDFNKQSADKFKYNDISNSSIKMQFKDFVPLSLPVYLSSPKKILLEPESVFPTFQCLYELNTDQAYSFGDWTLLKTSTNCLIMFHEFAVLWFELNNDKQDSLLKSMKFKSTKLFNHESLTYLKDVNNNKESEIKIYLIVRKEQNNKIENSEQNIQDKLNCFEQNSSVNNTTNVTKNNMTTTTTTTTTTTKATTITSTSNVDSNPALYNNKKLCNESNCCTESTILCNNYTNACCFDLLDGLQVSELKFDGQPVLRNDLADDLWNKVLPLILKVRNMHYGLLPLPLHKTSAPFHQSSSRSRRVGKSKSKTNCKHNKKNSDSQVPIDNSFQSGTSHTKSVNPLSDNNTLIPKGHSDDDTVYNKSSEETRGNFITQSVSYTVDQATNKQFRSEVDYDSHEPNSDLVANELEKPICSLSDSSTNKQNIKNPNLNNSGGTEFCDTKQLGQQQVTENSIQGSSLFVWTNTKSNLTANPSDISSKSTYYTPVESPVIKSDGVLDTDKKLLNKTTEMINMLPKKITYLYFGNIRLSVSFHGLWFTVDSVQPKKQNKQFILNQNYHGYCIHPECKSCWNPDFSDDETDYNEFADSNYQNERTQYYQTINQFVKSTGVTDENSMLLKDLTKLNTFIFSSSVDAFTTDRFNLVENNKCVLPRMLCPASKLGGIRVYGRAEQPHYQSGPLSRSTGYLRHRELRLDIIRQTVSYASLVLSKLLDRLMLKKLNGSQSRHSSISPPRQAIRYQTVLATQLRNYANYLLNSFASFSSNKTICDQSEFKKNSEFSFIEFISCVEKATPYELLESKLIPALWSWLKIERFPTAAIQFMNLPEQLLTRSVQLNPKLVKSVNICSYNVDLVNQKMKPYFRQLELSNSHLYVQPLVSIENLGKWLIENAGKVPWYTDELETLGFVHDLDNSQLGIHLLPPMYLLNENQLTSGSNSCNLSHVYYGGLFSWLGTNGGRENRWANPLRLHGFVRLTCSDMNLNQKPEYLGTILSQAKVKSKSMMYGEDPDIEPLQKPQTSENKRSVNIKSKNRFQLTRSVKSKRSKSMVKSNLHRKQITISANFNDSTFKNFMTPWIAIDLGVFIELKFYSIQVNLVTNQWPELTDWQLQVSVDGWNWFIISEHHINPIGNPTDYWSQSGEKLWAITSMCKPTTEQSFLGWRFVRLQQLQPTIKSTNFEDNPNQLTTNEETLQKLKLSLRNIEFYGTIHKISSSKDLEIQNQAIAYLRQFKCGNYVIPDLPICLCNQTLISSSSEPKCEHWPLLPKSKLDETNLELKHNWLNDPPLIGRILCTLSEGQMVVEWITPLKLSMEEDKTSDTTRNLSFHNFDPKIRFDLRIPSMEEFQLRIKLINTLLSCIYPNTDENIDQKHPDDSVERLIDDLLDQVVKNDAMESKQNDELTKFNHSNLLNRIPFSKNWLSGVFLPTFSNIMPFLFASSTPNLICDPLMINHGVISAYRTSSSSQRLALTPVSRGNIQSVGANTCTNSTVVSNIQSERNEKPSSSMLGICSSPSNQNTETTEPLDLSPGSSKLKMNDNLINAITLQTDNLENKQLINFVQNQEANETDDVDKNIIESIEEHADDDVENEANLESTDHENDIDQTVIKSDRDNHEEDDDELEEDEEDGDNIFDFMQLPNTDEMNITNIPSFNDVDRELEDIGRTLELRILANKTQDIGPHFRYDNESPTNIPLDLPSTVGNNLVNVKFDQWETVNPTNIDFMLKNCMNLNVLSEEQLTHLFVTYSLEYKSTQTTDSVSNDIDKSENPVESSSRLIKRTNSTSSMFLLANNKLIKSKQLPEINSCCLLTSSSSSSHSSFNPCLSSNKNEQFLNKFHSVCPSTPVFTHNSISNYLAQKSMNLDKKTTTTAINSGKHFNNKQPNRSSFASNIRVDNIQTYLPGFIPPFETRSGNSNQPSTIGFTIPQNVSYIEKLKDYHTGTNSKFRQYCVELFLHQDNMEQKLCPSTMSYFFTPNSSGSGSVSLGPCKISKSNISSPNINTAYATGGVKMPNDNPSTLDSGVNDVQKLIHNTADDNEFRRYLLDNSQACLLHYLLDNADYGEEFCGSGVLKPTSCQPMRVWNRSYELNYILYETTNQPNGLSHKNNVAIIPNDVGNLKQTTLPSFVNVNVWEQILEVLAMIYEFIIKYNQIYNNYATTNNQSQINADLLSKKIGRYAFRSCSHLISDCYHSKDLECWNHQLDLITNLFQSKRLTRKLELYCRDIWSVLSCNHWPLCKSQCTHHCALEECFNWTSSICTLYSFLLPFETRLHFWRISSLGPSRAIASFQKQNANNRLSTNNPFSINNGIPSLINRFDVSNSSNKENFIGRFWGLDGVFSWTSSIIVIPKLGTYNNCIFTSQKDVNSNKLLSVKDSENIARSKASVQLQQICLSPYLGIGNGRVTANFLFGHQTNYSSLGRLQRHMARVPRPKTEFTSLETSQTNMTSNPDDIEDNSFWKTTVRLLLSHADKKQELEIEFEDEEGTGLGPTMEFYAVLSAELRRHSHGLWVSDDRQSENVKSSLTNQNDELMDTNFIFHENNEDEIETFDKEFKDFHVNPSMGLFPAAWPANKLPDGAELRFYIMGIAIAKCLQDQRQMDLPFSNAFLTLLCEPGRIESKKSSQLISNSNISVTNNFSSSSSSLPMECQTSGVKATQNSWLEGILDLRHFVEIYPERGKFLMKLREYQLRKHELMDKDLEINDFNTLDLELQTKLFSTSLESLYLTMSFPSTTRRYGTSEFMLADKYDWEEDDVESNKNEKVNKNTKIVEEFLNAENVSSYIRRSIEFALDKGIRKQMNAFRDGFERVLPYNSLSVFSPPELGRLVSGESSPQWTYEELWTHCEPAAGYNKKSRGFRMLIETLARFDAKERRVFVYFVTGCPTLPPGGLKNLTPKLKVAKKDGTTCGPYPSVNTCMHYLKLPEYSNVQELKKHLLAAASQKGFYLN